MALIENQAFHRVRQQAVEQETNVPMTELPRDLRFSHLDSTETRDWKRRQQYYFSQEQKYGFLYDTLAKLGVLQAKDVEERREWMKQRCKSQKWITDECRKTSVSLRALNLIQQEYLAPSELLIAPTDTPQQKQEKVKKQIHFWVAQTTQSVEKLPHDRKSYLTALKTAKKENRYSGKGGTNEDVELFLLENEEELKQELDWDDRKFMDFAIHARKVAARAARIATVDDLIQIGPLDKLQLVRRGTFAKVEKALKNTVEIMEKRAREFEKRFGDLPLKIENDPYELEFNAQVTANNEHARTHPGS